MYETLKSILVEDIELLEEDIRPEASHSDAGLDSLAVVELSLALNKRLGVEISDDELLETRTIADIAELVGQRVPAQPAPRVG